MGCPKCGGPQIELFTSLACKAECDKKVVTPFAPSYETWKIVGQWTPAPAQPPAYMSVFEAVIRDRLANPPKGLGYLVLNRLYVDNAGLLKAEFTGTLPGARGELTHPDKTINETMVECELINLSNVLN